MIISATGEFLAGGVNEGEAGAQLTSAACTSLPSCPSPNPGLLA